MDVECSISTFDLLRHFTLILKFAMVEIMLIETDLNEFLRI